MRALCFVAILGLAIPSFAAAAQSGTETSDGLRSVTVGDLAALRTTGKVVVLDANGPETRSRYGVIPGAVLLTHYDDYDVGRELPTDRGRTLVFYCANERCMASHKAAQRAIDAGFTDVSVLPAGIMGWKNAGQPTGTL